MNCPTCHREGDRVTDKRPWQSGDVCGIRRRRECLHCKAKWTTIEVMASLGPDGSIVMPGLVNGHKPAPKPKPQKTLTARERSLKKRLATALYRARGVAFVIEGEELLNDPELADEAGGMDEFEKELEGLNG